MAEKRRRSCQDIQVAPAGDNGSEDTTLAAVTQSGTGSGGRASTFMPRFLWHHRKFDHGLVDGLGPTSWIQLRRIALSEWVILPVQEVAAYSWCSECEHLRSGTCPEERRAKWAHVGWSPWRRCASKIDGLLELPLSPQPTVLFQPGLPLQGPPPQSLWFPPGMSPHRMRFVTWSSISHHAVWNLCAPAAIWLRNQQQRSFNVAGSQAVGSLCSGTESPCEEFACASRPVGTHHGRKSYNSGSYCGTARPRRGCPHGGRRREPPPQW